MIPPGMILRPRSPDPVFCDPLTSLVAILRLVSCPIFLPIRPRNYHSA